MDTIYLRGDHLLDLAVYAVLRQSLTHEEIREMELRVDENPAKRRGRICTEHAMELYRQIGVGNQQVELTLGIDSVCNSSCARIKDPDCQRIGKVFDRSILLEQDLKDGERVRGMRLIHHLIDDPENPIGNLARLIVSYRMMWYGSPNETLPQ